MSNTPGSSPVQGEERPGTGAETTEKTTSDKALSPVEMASESDQLIGQGGDEEEQPGAATLQNESSIRETPPPETDTGAMPSTPDRASPKEGSKPATPQQSQHASPTMEKSSASNPTTPVTPTAMDTASPEPEPPTPADPSVPWVTSPEPKPPTPTDPSSPSAPGDPSPEPMPPTPTDPSAPGDPSPEPKPPTPADPSIPWGTPVPADVTGQQAETSTGELQALTTAPPSTPQPTVPPPPPPIEPAAAPSRNTAKHEKISSSALNLSWSFGLNKNVPVLNMTDDQRQSIMYPCGNAGIIYDFANNTQIILQGHSNDIRCSCASGDKRWVATADVGLDNMIIVWDSYTGVPVRTIFEPYPESGVLAITMTPDAKYIATLSAAEKQTLAIWNWTVEGDVPISSIVLDVVNGIQNFVLFNPENIHQLVTNSTRQVIFYYWEENGKVSLLTPPLTDEDFNKPVGLYSQSIFLAQSTRALSATSNGHLVVWDTKRPAAPNGPTVNLPDRRALKLVRFQEKGINVLTTTDKYIVAGDTAGHVKFFDQTLKLMTWYQDLHLGPINSLSFAHWPDFDPNLHVTHYPKDSTISGQQIVLKDFVIGSTPSVYAHVTTDGTNVEIIHRDHDAPVHGLSAHPCRHHIVIGSYSGLLKIWDYQTKEALVLRWFDKGLMIRSVAYDKLGDYIAVGFTNGSLRVVEALTLNDILNTPFRYARDAITHVAFSHDGRYLATADAEYTVSVFKVQVDAHQPWVYLGRNRAHYKLINDLCFGVALDSHAPRLLSLGADRLLVEYDLERSSTGDLQVASTDRLEQSAVPQCMAWYPPVTTEFFIVTANDQFKFKLYNTTTKMCRKTLLGPTYGSCIRRIVILPTEDPDNARRYLAYVTSDKIGIHKLPLDGNPHNAMALIAHPQGVANLVCSFDGKHLFTAGGSDCTVHMWDVNTDALEAQSLLGGEDLVPFYGLLDGARDGDLYKELEDYFYYAQIRSQGVNTTDVRRISTHIPLTEVPYVMRAMGFYPSEQEIEDMLNEVKYSCYVQTGQYITEVDLGDFIKLYVNHRPAFGLQPDKVEWAFKILGFDTDEGPTLDRGDLLELLQNNGEQLTELELAEYLTTLLGYNEEGGSSELIPFEPAGAGDIIEENLPQNVTAEMFANDLLGFSMYSEVMQPDGAEANRLVVEAGQG